MNTEELAEWLKPKLGGANVKHILNWGGFVNHSIPFTWQTGRRSIT